MNRSRTIRKRVLGAIAGGAALGALALGLLAGGGAALVAEGVAGDVVDSNWPSPPVDGGQASGDEGGTAAPLDSNWG